MKDYNNTHVLCYGVSIGTFVIDNKNVYAISYMYSHGGACFEIYGQISKEIYDELSKRLGDHDYSEYEKLANKHYLFGGLRGSKQVFSLEECVEEWLDTSTTYSEME